MHDLAFRLTNGELAFAVPGGVILGALVGLVGQWATSRLSIQSQKHQLLWQARVTLYEKAIPAVIELESRLSGLPNVSQLTRSPVTDEVMPGYDFDEEIRAVEQYRGMIETIASPNVALEYLALTNYSRQRLALIQLKIDGLSQGLNDAALSASRAVIAGMKADIQT